MTPLQQLSLFFLAISVMLLGAALIIHLVGHV